MMRRWLSSRSKKRARSMAAMSLQTFRFESLENRFCMAGDSDVLPISILALATPTDEQTHRMALVVQWSNNSEIICPVPATTAAFAAEVDLCIDNFVGARSAPAYAFDTGTLANTSSFDLFLQLGTERSQTTARVVSGTGNDVWSINATLRPDVTAVEQLRVVEGEGPSTVTVTLSSNEADASPPSQAEVSMPVRAREQSSRNRDSGGVAAIDWTTGSTTGAPNNELSNGNQLNAQDTASAPARGLAILSVAATATPVPSHRSNWTGLQPYRVPSVAQNAPEDGVRPQLSALPDVPWDAEATEVKREPGTAENAIAGRLISYSIPGETLQRLPENVISELPEVFAGTLTTELSEPSSTAPVLEYLPGDEESEKEGKKSAQALRSSPPSRLWYFAAMTVLSALPIRRRLYRTEKQLRPLHYT